MTEGMWFALLFTIALALLGLIGCGQDYCENANRWRR